MNSAAWRSHCASFELWSRGIKCRPSHIAKKKLRAQTQIIHFHVPIELESWLEILLGTTQENYQKLPAENCTQTHNIDEDLSL